MKVLYRILFLVALVAAFGGVDELRASIDFSNFHTPAQMDNELTNLATTNPSIAQIFTIGNSVEGRPIRGLKISNNVAIDDATKGDVVFISLQHAREWIAAEMALYLAEYLVTHYSTDPALQACMNNMQIWVIPVARSEERRVGKECRSRWSP